MTQRKLQSEIDKTIKKVAEGIETFDSIYEKINLSQNQAQKEKLEGDLKKEIKKLQRYRDQIKTWSSSNDIKDKSQLVENRKLIETQMERFKALEKDLKTKAFSQAGLNAVSKVDPLEEAKELVRTWLSDQTDALTTQIDTLETEQETLTLGLKKKRQTKSQTRLNEIQAKIEKHKYHQLKMEAILRMIDNGKLDPEQVEDVKEDVEYYVKKNNDDDFEENEYMYENLNLEEAEEIFAIGNQHDDEHHEVEVEVPKTPPREKEKEEVNQRASLPPLLKPKKEKSKEDKVKNAIPKVPVVPVPKLSGPVPIDPPAPPPTLRYASIAAAGASKSTESVDPAGQPSIVEKPIDKLTEQMQNTSIKKKESIQPVVEVPQLPKLERALSELFATPEMLETFKSVQNGLNDPSHVEAMLNCSLQSLPDAFDSSKYFLLNRSKNYTPTTPFPVPGYYPQSPLSIFSTTPQIFERFNLDTLFFAFYYRPFKFQQHLASKELKRQSWRFHKKYQTWFVRSEEPTEVGEEYEQGNYYYFEWERGWEKKSKEGFKFDYRFLEDDL